MTNIEQLLRERIGLDSASVGSGSIHRAVRLRMKALGLLSPNEYGKRLQTSRSEWNELLESVVVTETWFFRDREPFDALIGFVRERLSGGRKEPIRVLSVPCSSGEEPYSVVMALLDAAIPAEKIQVDAADISPRALLKARRAIFSRNSFRGKDLSFRDRYFHHTKEGYVLCPAVRTAVRFHEANVLNPQFLSGERAYDVIFCRNLLIYFDRPTQARALSTVARLLAPDGLLIVGAAEQPLAFENGFVSANLPLAFACRKAPVTKPPPHLHPTRHLALRPFPAPTISKARLKHSAKQSEPSLFAPPQARTQGAIISAGPVAVPSLTEAQRLADSGKFAEAAEICERCLRMDAASADGWYLLGLIRDALGDPLAIECYRRTLYLNPLHYETLLQMALHSERAGDGSRARTFRRRATRIKPDLNKPETARV